jgi:hypothetical protein
VLGHLSDVFPVPNPAGSGKAKAFLEGKVPPWFEMRKKELANRPLIREQAFREHCARHSR